MTNKCKHEVFEKHILDNGHVYGECQNCTHTWRIFKMSPWKSEYEKQEFMRKTFKFYKFCEGYGEKKLDK